MQGWVPKPKAFACELQQAIWDPAGIQFCTSRPLDRRSVSGARTRFTVQGNHRPLASFSMFGLLTMDCAYFLAELLGSRKKIFTSIDFNLRAQPHHGSPPFWSGQIRHHQYQSVQAASSAASDLARKVMSVSMEASSSLAAQFRWPELQDGRPRQSSGCVAAIRSTTRHGHEVFWQMQVQSSLYPVHSTHMPSIYLPLRVKICSIAIDTVSKTAADSGCVSTEGSLLPAHFITVRG